MSRTIVTLLTDFGTADSYVAQMKGELLSRCPDCILVDITHEISPQDIATASRVLAEAVPRFPDGTIHVAVVDPGVGTERRIVAVDWSGQRIVLPDNGMITDLFLQNPPDIVRLVSNERLWNQPVSPTFHGRDIIVPVAAFLASGGAINEVGLDAHNLFLLPRNAPAMQLPDSSWLCTVLGCDRFGNLMLSSSEALINALPEGQEAELAVAESGRFRATVVQTYGKASSGALILLRDSQNRLELAQVNGSAAQKLDLVPNASVKISPVSSK